MLHKADAAPHILIINGPNLNMLGKREPHIYGHETLEEIQQTLTETARLHNTRLSFFQSNHEGEIVDAIQQAMEASEGILINPGAYTHTSVAIRDALAMYPHPAIEIHLSNIFNREAFRSESLVAPVVTGSISGLGSEGYRLALLWMIRRLSR